jgi:uncharacterized protein (DUF488 family)
MGMNSRMPSQVFTIGHSSHPTELFIGMLKRHGIQLLVDTRSYPKSRFAPQYDSDGLRRSLEQNRIEYLFLGKELGGRPEGASYYDADGRVLYGRVAESRWFAKGLERLLQEMTRLRVAILCSEEDPSVCHRRLLIARVLHQRGIAVMHIRGTGELQSEAALLAHEAADAASQPQLSLFEHSPDPEWKSLLSVSPRRAQNSFSAS